MIPPPDGWRRLASAGSEIYASHDLRATLRYRSRVAPLCRTTAIVEAALAELPEWTTRSLGARERFSTIEGEHAFGTAIAGTWLGADATRYIGIVYGDDFYEVLDALSTGEPIETRARSLVRGATLRLGIRRRRYFYDRPFGWHGHATGLTTHWFPANFPARPATIVVYPANPTNEQPKSVLDAMTAHHAAHGAELREVAASASIVTHDGLEGTHWRLQLVAPGAPAVQRDLVVFARGAYTYALQLDSFREVDEQARSVFLAIAQSVEPVPVAGAAEATQLFSHYA